MKKVLFIGDIHGRTDWIKYATEALKGGHEVVFMGDYVDSFDHKGYDIEQNLLRIIAFKKKADNRKNFLTKVTLLLGNHDYSYLAGKYCSGKNSVWSHRYKEIFDQNWDLFDLAWGYTEPITQKYTLASHAGITESYWRKYIVDPNSNHYSFVKRIIGEDAFDVKIVNDREVGVHPMHEILNVLKDQFSLLWKVGYFRGGSDHPGILWADLSELRVDPYIGINQIVGHTGWHSSEWIQLNDTFIAKVDGAGKEVQRLLINLYVGA